MTSISSSISASNSANIALFEGYAPLNLVEAPAIIPKRALSVVQIPEIPFKPRLIGFFISHFQTFISLELLPWSVQQPLLTTLDRHSDVLHK